ncbi:MAG: hypothetical protein ACP5CD_02740 [Thermovirgaceae bacterium]
MELLWLALAVLLVLTSIAGILGTKRFAVARHVFYILLFVFFALAAFTLLRFSLVLAVSVLPALMLFVLILFKGKSLQTQKRGENTQGAGKLEEKGKKG